VQRHTIRLHRCTLPCCYAASALTLTQSLAAIGQTLFDAQLALASRETARYF
jgi:hypothetical protein